LQVALDQNGVAGFFKCGNFKARVIVSRLKQPAGPEQTPRPQPFPYIPSSKPNPYAKTITKKTNAKVKTPDIRKEVDKKKADLRSIQTAKFVQSQRKPQFLCLLRGTTASLSLWDYTTIILHVSKVAGSPFPFLLFRFLTVYVLQLL
jgi:hypothetical protein